MKKDRLIIGIVIALVFIFAGIIAMRIYFPKIYINNQKSEETNVEVGSEEYLSRIRTTVYFDERFPVKEDMIVHTYVNKTMDGPTYWYYAYSNNDILRIGEDYSFVYYSNCNYWNLSNELPSIVSYDSAYKYQVNTYSLWYLIWYKPTAGVEYNNNEIIDNSIFTNYKISWLGKGDSVEDFIKTRLFMYYYLKYIDEDINENGFSRLGDYEFIKELRMDDIEQEYTQEVKVSLKSMLYYAYFEEGNSFDLWIYNAIEQLGLDYDTVVAQIQEVEEYDSKIKNYMSHISLINDVPKIESDNPSMYSTEFDSILGIPSHTYCLDVDIISIYNNYNANNNIVTNKEYEEDDPEIEKMEQQEGQSTENETTSDNNDEELTSEQTPSDNDGEDEESSSDSETTPSESDTIDSSDEPLSNNDENSTDNIT